MSRSDVPSQKTAKDGDPFDYIEYAYATLGALQIWENYLRDPAQAIRQYREALALGATSTCPNSTLQLVRALSSMTPCCNELHALSSRRSGN